MAIVDSNVTRRSVLKWSGAVAGASALVGTGVALTGTPGVGPENAAQADGIADAETKWSVCVVNCGSRCPLRFQVKDGVVVRVLPENTGDNELMTRQIRACVRGRNIRERIYNPDRLKYPMKRREGTKRGEGIYDRISWEEATELFAEKMKLVYDKYGPQAVQMGYGSGTWNAHLATSAGWSRLFNLMGGQMNTYNNYSYAQIHTINKYHYGHYNETTSNSIEDSIQNSKMIVFWGNNPMATRMSGGGVLFTVLEAAKKEGLKIVVIDPRYTDTAIYADTYLAIRPGSDTALSAALAYVLITNNLHDQAFLDKYCSGFDEEHMPPGIPAGNSYKSYILGEGPDKTPKTPEWAARITGLPAKRIKDFAFELANNLPVNIVQGWGPQRHYNGENIARSIYTLANILGQNGIPGGGTGGREGYFWPLTAWMPDILPPEGLSEEEKANWTPNPQPAAISCVSWLDAIQRGDSMTAVKDGVRGADKLDTKMKFMMFYGSNMLGSQHPDLNHVERVINDERWNEDLFLVACDNQFTETCKRVDLILPDTSTAERWDLVPSEYTGDMAYLAMNEKAIDPLYECRNAYDMGRDIAAYLERKYPDQYPNMEQRYSEGRSVEDWARYLHETVNMPAVPGMPSFEDLRVQGVYRYYNPNGLTVSMKDFRDDPVANPLETPSGKIEIFSSELWEMANSDDPNVKWVFDDPEHGIEALKHDRITALPEHLEVFEGPEEALANEKYPLQMISHHHKGRVHSTYGNLSKNKEAHPQCLWINTLDAKKRGIKNDDLVHVFNDRGDVVIKAKVTDRIMPGVTSLPQGAWLNRDNDGVDHGGAANMLTNYRVTTVSKGNGQHTNLVQVEKAVRTSLDV